MKNPRPPPPMKNPLPPLKDALANLGDASELVVHRLKEVDGRMDAEALGDE
jgi:hypothetical protein